MRSILRTRAYRAPEEARHALSTREPRHRLRVWVTTTDEIAEWYLAHGYDQAVPRSRRRRLWPDERKLLQGVFEQGRLGLVKGAAEGFNVREARLRDPTRGD